MKYGCERVDCNESLRAHSAVLLSQSSLQELCEVSASLAHPISSLSGRITFKVSSHKLSSGS